MQVEIRTGGDGVACWNGEAIRAYAARIDAREQQLAGANPDLKVVPGQIRCYGCEVMEYDYGTRCTAILTLTRYAVEGELEPRAEDAKGSLLDIAGLETKIETPATIETHHTPEPSASAGGPSVRSGLRRLMGRS